MSLLEMENLQSLVNDLYVIGAIKTGEFTLKSGSVSPVYFDLRVIVSHPTILVKLCNLIWENIKDLKFDVLCGVPYAALPFASGIAVMHNVPMVIRRKEAKGYGTKNLIEGSFKTNDKCLIIEDVVTSGTSIYETVQVLESVGLKVTDVITVLDREQGGPENLRSKGINFHSLCTSTSALSLLHKSNKIGTDVLEKFEKYLSSNQEQIPNSKPKKLSYGERSVLCSNPLSKELFQIMEDKQTNLCLSADVTTSAELLRLANLVGPHICILKTHIDILSDFNLNFIEKLKELAIKHKFLIFEDRKYADIGNTVHEQYTGGIYKVSQWADIVNAHCLPGPGLIAGLKKGITENEKRGCVLVAEMSSADNLFSKSYTEATVKIAEENSDFVIGFICQSKLIDNPKFIHMMPGVKFGAGGDSLGQQYTTPKAAILEKNVDVIIVGRGITADENPAAKAKEYQIAAYEAYNS